VALADELNCQKIIAVVGHQEDVIIERFKGYGHLTFASQKEQLGTGHAVQCALPKLDSGDDEDILIICGDSPLLKRDTLLDLYKEYMEQDATVSILIAKADDPTNYGRIVKGADGGFLRIVEEKDADDEIRAIDEICTGTYIVKREYLASALEKIKNENAQNEYYLTDITAIAVEEGEKVITHITEDFSQTMGINTREELARAGKLKQREINKRLMLSGVTIIDPEVTYIEDGVIIKNDAVIHPFVSIRGESVIMEGATIQNGAVIINSTIGTGATVLPYCVIEKSVVEADTSIGPFARLRPDTVIKKGAKIGNFVEIKKSTVGEGSKAGHLTYLGDTTLGKDVNVGAGTITCNYDGVSKHSTVIEDNAFIGSNSALVAPVTIKKGALVGAGAVITKDVPEDTVAVERSGQKHYKKTDKDK
jgi:bifunctional UDP-N-acetylglucosamine pyrophosphorylase/glucosamine-1-phosphate N-acetyltransferase